MLEKLFEYLAKLAKNPATALALRVMITKVRIQIVAHPANLNENEVVLADMNFDIETVKTFFNEVPGVLAMIRSQPNGIKISVVKEIFKSAFQEEMNCYEEYYSDYSFADESETGKFIICPYCGNNQTQKEPYKSKSLGLDYTCLECENEFDESEVNVK